MYIYHVFYIDIHSLKYIEGERNEILVNKTPGKFKILQF